MIVVMHRPPLKRVDLSPSRPPRPPANPETLAEAMQRGIKQARDQRLWDAVTATAQASQQGTNPGRAE